MAAEGSKLKTWHKVAIGIVTVGVTATTIYFASKAIKKRLAKKKEEEGKKLLPKVDVKKDIVLTPSEKKAKADKLAGQIKAMIDQGQDSSAAPLKDELNNLGFTYDKGRAIA